MKKFLLFIFISVAFLKYSSGQAGMWTWINGDSIQSSPPVFGTQGLPSVNNHPAGLYELCEWKDLQGNFWVYGGMSPNYCDMWRYNPLTNEWTWMQGNGSTGLTPNYGIQGVADPANTPGERFYGSITWVDLNGTFWLFGGGDYRNDLWNYDPGTNLWTWVSGSTSPFGPAVYGTQGIPSTLNIPPGRQESASGWTDASGDLWLFGGRSNVADGVNDMWRYNISTNEWTWMHGSTIVNTPCNYGVLGVPDPSNTPGGRITYTKWYDTQNNFWIFGGANFTGGLSTRNDIWKYEPAVNEWTWMYGTSASADPGTYSQQCVFNNQNIPFSRWEQRAAVTDDCGKFWMFGGQNGQTFNDLMVFDPQQLLMNWVSGAAVNSLGNYGTMGLPSASNIPPSTIGGVAWWGNDNKFYLFGGGKGSGFQCYSDMWVYTPDTSCSTSCITQLTASFTAPNHLCPGTCTDFVNLSTNATSYTWFFPGATPAFSTDINPMNICYPATGSYDVTLIVSNANGSDTLTLSNYITVYPSPAPQSILQSSDTLFANTGATSYQWYYNGNIIPGATGYYYVAPASGDYNVVATDLNGCEVEAVIFDVVAGLIPAFSKGEGVTAFPNPVRDKLIILMPDDTRKASLKISIYNMLGEVVLNFEPEFSSHKQQVSIDVSILAKGIYWLEINPEEKSFHRRFVKD